MSEMLSVVYTGVVLGAVMATMATGLALVWGGLRMLNMAHGALIMVGAYLAYFASHELGLPIVLALVLAVILTGAAGAVMYPLIVRPLLGKPGWEINVIIATVALSLGLPQLVQLLAGPKNKSLPALMEGGFLGPAGLHVQYQDLLVTVVAVVVLVALGVFLARARYGVALRAVAQNLDGARIVGLSVGQVYVMMLGLSGALAGLAGVLLVSTGSLFITPTMGNVPLLQALVIVVLGGLGSIRGVIAASFLAGLILSATQTWLGSQWGLPVLFLTVVVILAVRPAGLFGTQERMA